MTKKTKNLGRRDTSYLFAFSRNAGKYRPEKTSYLDAFHTAFTAVKREVIEAQSVLNTPLWVFFTFFKLYKWYQIAQCITSHISEIRWHIFVTVRRLLTVTLEQCIFLQNKKKVVIFVM